VLLRFKNATTPARSGKSLVGRWCWLVVPSQVCPALRRYPETHMPASQRLGPAAPHAVQYWVQAAHRRNPRRSQSLKRSIRLTLTEQYNVKTVKTYAVRSWTVVYSYIVIFEKLTMKIILIVSLPRLLYLLKGFVKSIQNVSSRTVMRKGLMKEASLESYLRSFHQRRWRNWGGICHQRTLSLTEWSRTYSRSSATDKLYNHSYRRLRLTISDWPCGWLRTWNINLTKW